MVVVLDKEENKEEDDEEEEKEEEEEEEERERRERAYSQDHPCVPQNVSTKKRKTHVWNPLASTL